MTDDNEDLNKADRDAAQENRWLAVVVAALIGGAVLIWKGLM